MLKIVVSQSMKSSLLGQHVLFSPFNSSVLKPYFDLKKPISGYSRINVFAKVLLPEPLSNSGHLPDTSSRDRRHTAACGIPSPFFLADRL